MCVRKLPEAKKETSERITENIPTGQARKKQNPEFMGHWGEYAKVGNRPRLSTDPDPNGSSFPNNLTTSQNTDQVDLQKLKNMWQPIR